MSSPTPQLAKRKAKKLAGKERLQGSILLKERGPDSHWQRYVDAITLGMTKGDAAAYAGVSDSVVRLWQRNADEDEEAGRKKSVFRDFFAEVRSTRSKMLSRNLATVERCRQAGDLKAATWLLERHGYHKKTEVDATVTAQLTYTIDTQDEGA